eukprot:scaffold32737_cov76-Amphora_coffeaeformis.AAC.1
MSGVSLNGGAPPPPSGGGGFAPPPPPQPASNRVVLFSMTPIYENVYILYDAGKNNLHLPSMLQIVVCGFNKDMISSSCLCDSVEWKGTLLMYDCVVVGNISP